MTERDRLTGGILATDLEGALLPLPGHEDNERDLEIFRRCVRQRSITLVFVSGKSIDQVQEAIEAHGLPVPDWVLCEMGTQIFRRSADDVWAAEADFGARKQVSKADALHCWSERLVKASTESVVYAGNSEDDLSALVAGCRAILVGNADRATARRIYDEHRRQNWSGRLYLANQPATSGVLEGCRWFDLVPTDHADESNDSTLPASLGATSIGCNRTHFRVWAPRRKSVAVRTRMDGKTKRYALKREANGYFSGIAVGIGPGDRYQYSLDDRRSRPDPAAHFQPDGVHGDSQVVYHGGFPWQDADWRGLPKRDLIIYETHIGTMTEEGTFAAAAHRLGELKALGVTAIEIMPVAQSPGGWNWGYDGVDLFAPRNTYGTPDDFKSLVDACHASGIAVILDVVYNHVGPEGNYLAEFGPFFSRKHHTPWGDAFNYDGKGAGPVRHFVVENALYWLREYHLDGLRLDAVHLMWDDSEWTILDEIREAVSRYQQAAGRTIHLIAEANVFDTDLLATCSADKSPYDAIWCDDVMHSLYSVVADDIRLTGREYTGWEDLSESLEYGFIYAEFPAKRVRAGQRQTLISAGDMSYVSSLVVGLQTHDCVGNHPHGKRLHALTSVELQKAAAALVMLYPAIPLIFMGDERAAPSPFLFFVDFEDPRLRKAVDRGRAREYPQHVWKDAVSPIDERAFFNSKDTAPGDETVLAWYQALIQLRKQWHGQGYLDPQFLRVECGPSASLIRLRYEVPDVPPLFVVTRLQSPDAPVENVEIRVDGDVFLDSGGKGFESGKTLPLPLNRAIIGQGRCMWDAL